MVSVPLARGAYQRPYGRFPTIECLNRFFEENPTNREDQVSLLSRPPTSVLTTVGDGPIRANFTQVGVFNNDLFVVSGTRLYRVTENLGVISIGGVISGSGIPRS